MKYSCLYNGIDEYTKLTYSDGDCLIYTYDELNRLTQISNSATKIGGSANNLGGLQSAICNYSYDPLSRRTQLKLANNTQTNYVYDEANRLTTLTNSLPTKLKTLPADIIFKPANVQEIEPIDMLGSVSLDLHKIISQFITNNKTVHSLLISGHTYYYLQRREGKKVIHKYIGKEIPKELKKSLEKRETLKRELAKIQDVLMGFLAQKIRSL